MLRIYDFPVKPNKKANKILILVLLVSVVIKISRFEKIVFFKGFQKGYLCR